MGLIIEYGQLTDSGMSQCIYLNETVYAQISVKELNGSLLHVSV
jgi:hypothetical protein